MSEPAEFSATIEGFNRLLSDNLGPELQRQEIAIEVFLSEARQVRERLHAAMERVGAELTAPFDAAYENLNQVEALLDSLVIPALEPATSPTAALFQTESGKASKGVNDVRQSFGGIQQALSEAQKSSKDATAEAERGVGELVRQLEIAWQALDQAVQVMVSLLNEAGERIGTAETRLGDSLGVLQQLVEQHLDALQSHADESMQQADAGIAKMSNDASRAMDDFCGNAEEILDSLTATAEKVSELFDGEASELLDKVQDLQQVIEQIRPLLEVVKQWT
ncbi:hypothetical protein [Pseudomonas sp. C32]|uniref:hypothetical protein n=1 Tax=Pseudomonas sp. C32 TaxID=1529208 RepID=UPI0026095421|nr:hypothetical protein [Pseudomonas sp. C32]MDN4547179.1 hypothetical protein [Pseudomonas sp. C32]